MTIAVDASSPVAFAAQGATSVTSASFTPPASSFLVLFVGMDANVAGTPGEFATITSSPAFAWKTLVERYTGVGGGAGYNGVFGVKLGASPGAMTVTATTNRADHAADGGIHCFLRVLTGASSVGRTFDSSGKATESYAASLSGSWGWYTGWGSIASITAATGCTVQDATTIGAFEGTESAGTSSRTTPDGVQGQITTVGLTLSFGFALTVEVLPDNSDPVFQPRRGAFGPGFKIFNPWLGAADLVGGVLNFTDSSIVTAHAVSTDTAGTKDVSGSSIGVAHAVNTDLAGTKATSVATAVSSPRVQVTATGIKAITATTQPTPRDQARETGLKGITATTSATPHAQTATGATKAVSATTTAPVHAQTAASATKAASATEVSTPRVQTLDSGTKATSATTLSTPRVQTTTPAQSGAFIQSSESDVRAVTKVIAIKGASSTTGSTPHVQIAVSGTKAVSASTQPKPRLQTQDVGLKGSSATTFSTARIQTTTPAQAPAANIQSSESDVRAITKVIGLKGMVAQTATSPRVQTVVTTLKGTSSGSTAVIHVQTTTPAQIPVFTTGIAYGGVLVTGSGAGTAVTGSGAGAAVTGSGSASPGSASGGVSLARP